MGAWDSPWHFIVLAIIVVLLFGSKRLPDAARSLGKSMRIFRSELRGMREDDAAAQPSPLPPAGQAPAMPAGPVSPGPVAAEPAEPGEAR